MSRRDQYGTHDEHNRGYAPEETPPPRRGAGRSRRGPDYGNGDELQVRTSRDGRAQFQGRDYERENYGGGYKGQHTHDVPSAGRRGEWMRKPVVREWRGQVGASGMDGLASDRAFGTGNNEQMSALDTSDNAYRRWRQAELDAHDDDYRAWRNRQARRYDEDYARWKASRRDRQD